MGIVSADVDVRWGWEQGSVLAFPFAGIEGGSVGGTVVVVVGGPGIERRSFGFVVMWNEQRSRYGNGIIGNLFPMRADIA